LPTFNVDGGLLFCQLAEMQIHPLTKYRELYGKTQQEIAASVGVTRWTINRIELGDRAPSVKLARRLASLTGIRLADLRPDIFEAAQ
jgi:DNA-binding XRE family transcriptional regulator